MTHDQIQQLKGQTMSHLGKTEKAEVWAYQNRNKRSTCRRIIMTENSIRVLNLTKIILMQEEQLILHKTSEFDMQYR